MNETIEFNHRNIKENLKIVVDNKNGNGCEASESDLLDYDEMDTDDNVNSNAQIDPNANNNNRSVEIAGDEANQVEQNEEDETEFHVNLDKVPPTLQNTILVCLFLFFAFFMKSLVACFLLLFRLLVLLN
jgi:stress response protein SCP2